MFKTRNDLSESIRSEAIGLLNARLADAIDLQSQTKQAHWNVKGPNFLALHELFDKINEDVEDYVDELAERAVQLGGVAEGTARMAVKRSSLGEYPSGAVDGRSHVDALSSVLALFFFRLSWEMRNSFCSVRPADGCNAGRLSRSSRRAWVTESTSPGSLPDYAYLRVMRTDGANRCIRPICLMGFVLRVIVPEPDE